MRYFIKFSYDGSCFNGFQRQPGMKTVQGVIEDALFQLSDCIVNLCASGRTDKGVHAIEQCAHFDLNLDIKEYNLKKYLNSFFDGEIYVSSLEKVSDSFHARYDVKKKVYSYYINMGEFSPVSRNYVYQLCEELDVSLMKSASLCLLGKHDFRSFCTDEKSKDNCVRTITNAYITLDEYYKDEIVFTFEGNGFLRYQVRNMVGLLIKVGTGKIDYKLVKEILDSKVRGKYGTTAKAEGLYLKNIVLRS